MTRQDYVLGLAFNADRSRIVLIRKTRPAWQAGKYNAIGGKIDADEHPLTAMCREFQEETGVSTTDQAWHHFADIVGNDGTVYCYRLFDDAVLTARTMEDQAIEIISVSIDTLRQHALPSVAWLAAIALDETQPIFFVQARYNQDFITGKTGTSS